MAISTIIRGAAGALLAALVILAPGFGWGGLALSVAVVGVLAAGPMAVAGAIRQGHRLAPLAPHRVRRLLSAPFLRLLVAAGAGLVLALVLVVRLAAGGAHALLPALAAALAFAAVWSVGLPSAQGFARPPFDRLYLRRFALLAATGAGVVVYGLCLALLPGPSLAQPDGGTALWAEFAALHRLWTGWEVALLGAAETAGPGYRTWAALALALAQTGAAAAVGAVCAGLVLTRAEWARAFATASADPEGPAMARGRAGGFALAMGACVAVSAGATQAWLQDRAPGDRPAAWLQVEAERVTGVLVRAGTLDALATTRASLDADARAEMEAALDRGFDAMLAGVDPFLDWYYTLPAEYARLAAFVTGGLEAELTRRLAATLEEADPFAEAAALLDEASARDAALAARLAAERSALVDAARLGSVNPARLVVHEPAPAAAPPAPFGDMQRALQARGMLAMGTGAVTGLLAGRIVARVAARGTLSMASRMVVRVVGPRAAIAAGAGLGGGVLGSLAGPGGTAAGVAFGVGAAIAVDAMLLELEEALARESFRAELVGAIEEQRAGAKAALAAP